MTASRAVPGSTYIRRSGSVITQRLQTSYRHPVFLWRSISRGPECAAACPWCSRRSPYAGKWRTGGQGKHDAGQILGALPLVDTACYPPIVLRCPFNLMSSALDREEYDLGHTLRSCCFVLCTTDVGEKPITKAGPGT